MTVIQVYSRRWEDRGRRRSAPKDQPARTAAEAARTSYYGVPVIHKSHWRGLIVAYFFLGGLSGAGYVIASLAALTGREEDRDVVVAGRLVSFLALLPCPALLIFDLQRPERFLHMLRVVKLRSPMSVGTWGLLVFSGFSSLSALTHAARGGLLGDSRPARLTRRLPDQAIGTAGIVPGFLMSGYTGVLLGATAVPIWAKNALLLGPLFMASAFTSAASAIALVLAVRGQTHPEALARVEAVERIARVAEAGLLVASTVKLGETARPATAGRAGTAMKYGAIGVGMIAPALLHAANRRYSRPVVALASALTLAGGIAFRYAVVMAGHASADDPQATFDFTRRSDDTDDS